MTLNETGTAGFSCEPNSLQSRPKEVEFYRDRMRIWVIVSVSIFHFPLGRLSIDKNEEMSPKYFLRKRVAFFHTADINSNCINKAIKV